ncbi:hypothetical protein MSAN_00088600 [Mycena sanguinolenta]|uniref:F-box domain-containing protein n=1 Tax=Mycena sanguinolenta TaxID=230812 RepID=A0A8H6ZI40_9AGAR|nr:hypothetical protein MSAN_00088600 [Mycena sanguinolenta]
MPMVSPFGSRLGTNYCPKDNELLEIRALLVEPTGRLQRLDDEIAELQKAIDKLAEERHSLQTFVDGHQALISPVRRLPLDIIQEIFIACIPTHRNCVMSASEAPVLLGRVCSSWRAISLGTPRLWARLHVVEPQRGRRYNAVNALIDEKIGQRLAVAKMWLARSGQCPLSISLQSGSPDDDDPTPPETPLAPSETRSGQFLQELVPYAGRWKHIKVTTPPFELGVLAHLTPADVPMLESVALYPKPQFPPRGVNWEQFGLLGAPRLGSFFTTGSSFDAQCLQALPCHQLTELTIGNCPAWGSLLTSSVLLRTLSQCTGLRSCNVVVNDGVPLLDPAPHQQQIVELAFLHTFRLDCGRIACNVLDWLSLPQLRDFTLHGHTDHSLAPFFRLCIHLETLRIDSHSFTKSTLQDSLRALAPTVAHLAIRDDTAYGPVELPLVAALDDDVLALLTPAAPSGAHLPDPVACPGLETLTITHCCTISDAALLRFITARMGMADSDSQSGGCITTRLKRVKMQFKRVQTQDIMPALAPFIDRGLDAEISYLPPLTTHLSPWQGLADAPSLWGLGWGSNDVW